MQKGYGLVAVLSFVLSCTSAKAQTISQFMTGAARPAMMGVKETAGSLSGCRLIGKETNQPCNSSSYTSFCPSGRCGCLEYDCTSHGGLDGTGSASTDISIDFGNSADGGTPDCYPIFGDLFLYSKIDIQTIFFNGSVCDPVSGTRASLLGGWALVDWNIPKILNGAEGQQKGTIDTRTGAFSFSYRGKTF